MTPTHVYRHPEGLALGHHHANLEGREFFDAEEARGRGLHEDEIAFLQEAHEQHRRNDMADGTQVEFDHVMPNGLYRVLWTDSSGVSRATSIEPEFFSSNFSVLEDAPAFPTHSGVQEHDYEREPENFTRPDWRPRLKTVTVPADFSHPAIVAHGAVLGSDH